MNVTQSELLTEQLEITRKWTRSLIADLDGDDWLFQPQPGMAHALWLCGHMTCTQYHLIYVRVLGVTGLVDQTFVDHFPIGGPVKAASEHDYPPVETVLSTMNRVHRRTCEVVREMTDDLLAEPAFAGGGKPHPLYADKRGAVAHCSRHEAFHAGQIATIRRLLGKPFLR